jgi:hypothetical protein
VTVIVGVGRAIRPGGDADRVAVGRRDRKILMPPAVVIRPIWLLERSVNHNAPSGPVLMSAGLLPKAGSENSVTAPSVMIRPIFPPSGPAVMAIGLLLAVGIENSAIPFWSRPIWSLTDSVNQSAPSGPVAMILGSPPVENSVMVTAGTGTAMAHSAAATATASNAFDQE